MLRVDTILFSNVTTAVQRTANLTGGPVRGLPGGAVVEGLKGTNSFNAEMAEAQKEYHQGRLQSALQRVRQMEMQFNGIAGRWNGTVGSIISSARTGKLSLPVQKLNELKNAQAKMQQLTNPVNKTFRDLINALDHAVCSQGHTDNVEAIEDSNIHETPSSPVIASDAEAPVASTVESKSDLHTQEAATEEPSPAPELLGQFAGKYLFGTKLRVELDSNRKARLSPKLEEGQFYFLQGTEPPRVVRVREVQRASVLVYDPLSATEQLIDAAELKRLLRSGIWSLLSGGR
jgi:hypothetical protein